jgi:hypothetical protein
VSPDQEDRLVAAILVAGAVAAQAQFAIPDARPGFDPAIGGSPVTLDEEGARAVVNFFWRVLPLVRQARRADVKNSEPEAPHG